jgi:hypothetical protein
MSEKAGVFTPLGLRFWDSALNRQVGDSLGVKAWPCSGSGPAVNAFRTASGVYAFQGLPGLREVEAYDGDRVPAVPPGGKKLFAIEIKDRLRRFLPIVFKVELPLSYRGIYRINGEPAPGEPAPEPRFYLVSAPTRAVSTGMAVIYAGLIDRATGNPAAHALMTVEVEGEETRYGIADERGNIAILFPYPTLKIPLSDSLPAGDPVPLTGQSWPITIRVRYEPDSVKYPPGMKVPYFNDILNQEYGVIRTTYSDSPPGETVVNEWSTFLYFGRGLVLRTHGADKSELWIDKHINDE